jgi:hypothetical protein
LRGVAGERPAGGQARGHVHRLGGGSRAVTGNKPRPAGSSTVPAPPPRAAPWKPA